MRTSAYPPLRWVYTAAYAAILTPVVARLRFTREIRSVQLRLPSGPFCFGSSDLDLWGVVKPLRMADFFALSDRLSYLLEPETTLRRIIDLYLLSEAEAEVRSRVESQSSLSPRIRLIGRGTRLSRTAAGPEHARLGRVMYRFMSMCRMVSDEPLDIHDTRILCKNLVNIDTELRTQQPAPSCSSDYETVIAEARSYAQGTAVRDDEEYYAIRLLAGAVEAADRVSAEFTRPSDSSDEFATTPYSFAPMGLERNIARVRKPIGRLCADIAEFLSGVMLGGNPGFASAWRTYFVVRDGLSSADRVKVYRRLLSLEARSFFRRFGLGAPIVLTPSMWRSMHRWYHIERPVEEFYFLKRYGAALWGDDLRDQLSAPSQEDMLRSAATSIAHLRSNLWKAVRAGQPLFLSNLILGRLPILWLLLTRGVIASSAGEAMAAALNEGIPNVDTLARLYSAIHGLVPRELPPTSDAVWHPALEKATEWIDASLESALRQVH